MDAAAKFKSMQADARVIKHYASKIRKGITESIQNTFDEAFASNGSNAAAFLANLDWVYQDLIHIETDVVPCFPESWDIHSYYVKEYHKALNAMLKKIVASEPEASALLALNQTIKDYKKKMKELEISPELLNPPLLDGNEQDLVEDYLKLIIKKLEEWTENLIKTEVASFTQREEPPETNSDGLYGMQGAVILFQMVNQQVDLAMESGQGMILARTIEEVNRVMRGVQTRWLTLIGTEFKKFVEKPDEVPGGLVEYCIALANDQLKSADSTETLSARIEPLVSEKYRVPIHDHLNDAIDGFLDVAKKCQQTLIDIIFNDLKPALKQLFQPPWYDGVTAQIIETVRDYMSDYNSYLNQTLVELLVEDLIDTFLVSYLNALANAPKLKMPQALERMRSDIDDAYKLFGQYKKLEELEPRMQVLDMVLSILEASQSLVFLSYYSFAKVYGPNIAFVENLLKARGDLDRSGVSEAMESIKRKVQEDNLTDRAWANRVVVDDANMFTSCCSGGAHDYEEGHSAKRPLTSAQQELINATEGLYTSNIDSSDTYASLYSYIPLSLLLLSSCDSYRISYAVFFLATCAFPLDLSGKAAATSSIFLNCQGNREGYKKGRRSNPRGTGESTCQSFSWQLTVVIRAVLFLQSYFSGQVVRTAAHGTYSVVGWRERGHLVPVPCILEEEQLNLLSDLWAGRS